MDHPSQLLKRVRQRRARPIPSNRDVAAPTPPAPAPVAPSPDPAPGTPEPAVPSAVRRGGSHALYSAVMKSHDRMGTRHL